MVKTDMIAKIPMVIPSNDKNVRSLFAMIDWYENCILSRTSFIKIIKGLSIFIGIFECGCLLSKCINIYELGLFANVKYYKIYVVTVSLLCKKLMWKFLYCSVSQFLRFKSLIEVCLFGLKFTIRFKLIFRRN